MKRAQFWSTAIFFLSMHSCLPTFAVPAAKPLVRTINKNAKVVVVKLPQSGANVNPYFVYMQQRIRKNWYPPKGLGSKVVVVRFNVEADGSLNNMRLEKSTGNMKVDQAPLKAVENAAPFKGDASANGRTRRFEFTFSKNFFDENL